MPSAPIHSPADDATNPYAPPTSDVHHRRDFGDPEAEALRRANAPLEAYAKALGVVNFIYFVFFGMGALYFANIAIGHLRGTMSAPWIVRPGWLVLLVTCWGMTILAFSAGCGFLRLRRWALWIEIALTICWFSSWLIDIWGRSTSYTAPMLVAGTMLHLALATPMINIADLLRSVVFDDEYSLAIQKTPYIKVRPGLSRELWLIPVVLFVLSCAIGVYSVS